MAPPKAKAMFTRFVEPRKQEPGTTACQAEESLISFKVVFRVHENTVQAGAPLVSSALFPEAAATSCRVYRWKLGIQKAMMLLDVQIRTTLHSDMNH